MNRPTSVQLLSIEQPSAGNPIFPMVRNGQLQYLGDEEIVVADQTLGGHFKTGQRSGPGHSFF